MNTIPTPQEKKVNKKRTAKAELEQERARIQKRRYNPDISQKKMETEAEKEDARRAAEVSYEEKCRIDGWTNNITRRGGNGRESLIRDLLSRWWYVFPMWPPEDFDYAAKLDEYGMIILRLHLSSGC